MTTADIIAQVRSSLSEPVAGFWTDTELLRWINRAVADFVNRTRILENKDTTSVTAGISEYPLPNNCLSIKGVFIDQATNGNVHNWVRIKPSNLEKTSQEARNFLSNDTSAFSDPVTYWVWGRTLNLSPTPKNTGIDNMVVFYKSKPISIVTTADQLDLDDSLHEGIIAYVLWRAFEKEKEFDQAQYHRGIYEDYIKHGLRWQKKQSGDQRFRLDLDSPNPIDGTPRSLFNPLR